MILDLGSLGYNQDHHSGEIMERRKIIEKYLLVITIVRYLLSTNYVPTIISHPSILIITLYRCDYI